MSKYDYENKIKQLIDKLNYYTKLYDEGKPEISDKEWDTMYFELVSLENSTGIYFEDSPTQRVNYQVVNKLNKVEHSHPMLSLDKTKDINVVKSFIGNKDYIVMAKMDGLTCSLTYENGKLVAAETRGNGIIGEDILHNALQVKNIPNKINYKNRLIIDGEIICTYKDFKPFANEYKNPRNFASGSIRLLDSKESASRNLTFVAWDLIEGGFEENKLMDKLIFLQELGFDIVPSFSDSDNSRIEIFIEDIKRTAQAYGYPIDGIVVKYNKIKEYEAAGRTDHHFKGGIAYKFYDEEYKTTLKDIEWSMGRTGQLTPVAIFEPIDIDGTEVSRASLHNISIMENILGAAYYGQKVYVAKMNMIIPQIIRAEGDEIRANNILIPYPKVCPICGEPTSIHKDNDSEVLYCDNPSCQGKLLNQLDHFCSKKGLDIKGLSKATIEKLINWGWVSSKKDIFLLENKKQEWIKKPGFGELSVNKILKSIEEAKETELSKIIAAASIPEIGISVAKDLSKYYNSWEEFRNETNFLNHEGIGEIMNKNLLNYDYAEIDFIVKNYLIIKKNNVIINIENNLKDISFCITGKLEHKEKWKNRDELKSYIESLGGKVTSSITSKTDYLINNDFNSTSSKNLKAKELNIPIITEEQFINKFLTK